MTYETLDLLFFPKNIQQYFLLCRGTDIYANSYTEFENMLKSNQMNDHVDNKLQFLKRKGRSILEAENSANFIMKMYENIPAKKRKIVSVEELNKSIEEYSNLLHAFQNVTEDKNFKFSDLE